MARIEQQLEGLATMSPARLRSEWRRLHRGQPLAAGLTPSQLTRSIAWRLQEKMLGGLPSATVRELNRLAEHLATNGELESAAARTLKPGSQLVRHWHNQAHTVTVNDEGFEYKGQVYPSLTKVARQITGAAWSGPRFFGLKSKGGPREA